MFQTIIGTSLHEAQKWLELNELVAIPTETVYGLAANAFSVEAILKVFHTKNRPTFNPLIVHAYDLKQASPLTAFWHPKLFALYQAFAPGPITFLVPKTNLVHDIITAGQERVAIRFPAHPLTQQLLQNLAFPLVAPSANPFGYVSPTTANHVYEQLNLKIPYILDGGSCAFGIESTIVGIENQNDLAIYRLGSIPIEHIEKIVGEVQHIYRSSSKPAAPGLLSKHYAPNKPLYLVKNLDTTAHELLDKHQSFGVITFGKTFQGLDYQLDLSPSRSLDEAAAHFFNALRMIEAWEVPFVIIEPFPDRLLGKALNDKLQRATTPFPYPL